MREAGQRKAGAVVHGPQQQHIVRIDHRRVGRLPVTRPDRSAVVERVESRCPGRHVAEAADPHEAVGIVQVAELADHAHADGFLGLDELRVEQRYQDVALARMQGVLA